jgi:mono/diheme cytochrome c family protein
MKALLIASLTLSSLGTLIASPDSTPNTPDLTEPAALFAPAPAASLPDPATLSDAERLDWGRTVYRRSCINCHGIQPQGLAHENPQRFASSVLDGRGEMPALGFKLEAAEVTVAQAYVAVCSDNYSVC